MPYLSGMLSTRRATNGKQKFGSWHMKVRLPGGKGAFAAVWSWPSYTNSQMEELSREDKDVEVDFVEQPGHTNIQYHNLHQPVFDVQNKFAASQKIFNNANGRNMPLPDVNNSANKSGLRGFVDTQAGSTSLVGQEWDGQHIQQHQVILPNVSQRDFTQWQELIWDWYPDNTCAWFINVGTTFYEAAHANMSPKVDDGIIDERLIFINNAFDSAFNCQQEFYDLNYSPFRLRAPGPWLLELEYIKTYLWDSGTTQPFLSVQSDGPTVRLSSSGVEPGQSLTLEFNDANGTVIRSASVVISPNGSAQYLPPVPSSYTTWSASLTNQAGQAASLPGQPRNYASS